MARGPAREENLRAPRRVAQTPPQPIMRVDGRRVLAFCGDDYLGLASHPLVIEALAAGAREWGAGAASPLFGHAVTTAHRALEEELAAFLGRERVVLFADRDLANHGAVGALCTTGDLVLADREANASLLDAARLSGAHPRRFLHADARSLRARLARASAAGAPGRTLVATDGVFGAGGDCAPLGALAAECAAAGALLMVDDGYGFGVLGERGQGSCERFGVGPEQVPVLSATFANALGTGGAFVAGDGPLIETIARCARAYRYGLAMPGAVAEAARVALGLLESQGWRRESALALSDRFRRGATRLGLRPGDATTPIQPLEVGDSARALAISEALFRTGILVPALTPPAVPRGTARLRVTLTAAHTTGQVDSLLSALEEVWEEPGEA